MKLIQSHKKTVKLQLNRDLVRIIKQGHPWVFADALKARPSAPAGSHAILHDHKQGREVAKGFYDPHSPLAFRVCTPEPAEPLNDSWAETRLNRALDLRRMFFNEQTTGYRLLNGEGDGLPGLICDVYGDTAVLQLDGAGPAGFWHIQGVAGRIAEKLSLAAVYQKGRTPDDDKSGVLVGRTPGEPVPFLENGISFTANVIKGQKTGFFLDQRENRRLVQTVAARRRVLNVFGYTGGFSIYAGLGGAAHVTTVDLAAPALEVAQYHWRLNNLPPTNHATAQADAFAFLEESARRKKTWDLVIVDPPSFAPSKKAVKQALAAYHKLIAAAAAVTAPIGLLAAASCSSHVDLPMFLSACESGISTARRRATVLQIKGQPPDHPTPLPFEEGRYLKFVLMRVE